MHMLVRIFFTRLCYFGGFNISCTLISNINTAKKKLLLEPFLTDLQDNLSRDVRKPDFRICENKDADQLRGNREADQRLCFRYTDSTIPLLPKSEILSP